MMSSAYSHMLIDHVTAIIGDESEGTITRWTAVKDLLLTENIAYLVHPEKSEARSEPHTGWVHSLSRRVPT